MKKLDKETKDALAEAYSKLTKSQLDFVHNFIQADFKNATACYCNAYPDAKGDAASAAASRLLSSVNVRACITMILDAMMAEAKIPLEKRIFETWMARAFYDVADIIDGDGQLAHSMQELKKIGLSIVIDGIDIKPDKDGGEHVVYKLADKDRALEMLQKYIQMIKQPDAKVKGTGPDGQAFAFTVEFLKPEEK
jgi:Terminase small subunit